MVLIVDYGSQYSQLIARRIRDNQVFCQIISPSDLIDALSQNPQAIILSGGPNSVDANSQLPTQLFAANVPILAICYGMQLIAHSDSGQVKRSDKHEYGATTITIDSNCPLFKGLSAQQLVWMSHGDSVVALPEHYQIVAKSNNCPIASFADSKRQVYAIQFHPEVTHTQNGNTILRNFLFTIAKLPQNWSNDFIIDDCIKQIRQTVGNNRVILGLSGGVDSSVAALLLQRAIGDRLHCIFIDNGLLRLNEAEQVLQSFKPYNLNITHINAETQFLKALQGVADPETKRKVIGKTFIDVFSDAARNFDGVQFLAQGTIYPDVIESSGIGKHAKVIKSHHNVGGLPKDLQFQLVEPLKWLFKDEVRKIGVALGLDKELLHRHPFPGPGLGVRILGEVNKQYADILRQADHIFIEELHKSGWYAKLSQAFAVFLPVQSVGVVGDYRRYAYVIALRAVETVDFMTANCANLPTDLIATVANRIVNEIEQVSRVVYDVSSKPPATIEWE